MKKMKFLFLISFIAIIMFMVPNVVKATSETWKDTAQNIEWSYDVDGAGSIIDLKCETSSVSGTVKIPSTINGKTVIQLDGSVYRNGTVAGAFENCTGITGVEIPSTITVIGQSAFKGCTGLKSVIIPDSVTYINSYAFEDCYGLTSVSLSKKYF